jgi:hypothetical protein
MIYFNIALFVSFVFGTINIFFEKPSKLIKSVLFCCLVMSSFFAWNEYNKNIEKENYSTDAGEFNFVANPNEKISLCLASNCSSSKEKIQNQIGNDKLDAWIENKKLNLKLTVRDYEGNIVFYVDGIDWKNLSGKEFNYDNNGVEIKDSRGNIIFQLTFDKDNNKVNIFGFLFYGSNNLVWFGKNTEGRGIMVQDPTLEDIVPLTPMFR